MKGRIELITGCMFSGKTTELIRRIQCDNQEHLVLKPFVDVRYNRDFITNHKGLCIPATNIENNIELFSVARSGSKNVYIDEIQFFDGNILEHVLDMAEHGINVIGCGLTYNSNHEPFKFANSDKDMHDYLRITNRYTHMFGKCGVCDSLSTHTQRLKHTDDIINFAGDDLYAPRCLEHYVKL